MKIINRKIDGDTVIAHDTKIDSTVVGSVTVSESTLLQLHGNINGNLILSNDSTAYIYGTVNGNVNNIGGFLEVFGTVNGKVICESGVCLIDSRGAVTGGLS